MEAKRLHKRIFRGSSSAEDEARFKEITGRDASTFSRESPVQRRRRLARESLRKLIKKEKASSVERIWYRKLSCGEDVESVMRNGESSFLKTKPANLDLEASVIHLQEARKERLEEICEPLDILIKFNDIVPADEVETQPDLQSAACSRLNTILSTQSTIDQVINELFIMNEDTNESSMEIMDQSPGFVPLPDLDALLPR